MCLFRRMRTDDFLTVCRLVVLRENAQHRRLRGRPRKRNVKRRPREEETLNST